MISTGLRRLLIVACSQRKRPDPGLLPAIQRYDGPVYRVLRRYLDAVPVERPDVYILSAEFGLRPCTFGMPYYDRRMTQQRAQELHSRVVSDFSRILRVVRYQRVFICAGQDYLRALEGYDRLASSVPIVQVSRGSMGRQLSQLHDWLYGQAPVFTVTATQDAVRIRGVEVIQTAEQVLSVARQAIGEVGQDATNVQSWCVLVDGHRIAPKWLVSQLTGLPVSAFGTDEARRVLAQLGIEVIRA